MQDKAGNNERIQNNGTLEAGSIDSNLDMSLDSGLSLLGHGTF